MFEKERCCCNCRHDIRVKDSAGICCRCECDIDGHYIGYLETFEGWCHHWASDKEKWEKEGGKNEMV